MPSGRTHDLITWSSALPAAGLAWYLGWPLGASAGLGAGILVGGLWLSPDLDLRSRPYRRWGLLRGIWHPYQALIRHRSVWSHGLIRGPLVRLLYLAIVLGGLGALLVAGLNSYVMPLDWHQLAQSLPLGRIDPLAIGSTMVGIWVGSGLHGLADGLVSAWGRRRRRWRR